MGSLGTAHVPEVVLSVVASAWSTLTVQTTSTATNATSVSVVPLVALPVAATMTVPPLAARTALLECVATTTRGLQPQIDLTNSEPSVKITMAMDRTGHHHSYQERAFSGSPLKT